MAAYVIGVDFGTNSVRAIVLDSSDGNELGNCVFLYPSGIQGILLDRNDHNLARQNPADYIVGLRAAITGALQDADNKTNFRADSVIGIGIDTTGSTPIPVDQDNVALALKDEWADNLSACAWLWKDHTSSEEARRITELAGEHRPHYLSKCGMTYSPEWFWSKVWHCLNNAPDVFESAYSWVECTDYITALLCGVTDPRAIRGSICTAGHKAMYNEQWGGFPDKEFLSLLNPKLADLRDRLFSRAADISQAAGHLCMKWADELGLPAGIPVAVGALDAHLGAVGAGVAPGTLVKVLGTSGCDLLVMPADQELGDIPGICGIAHSSVLPKHHGIEAGQAAVGDLYKWFVETVCNSDAGTHAALTAEAELLKPGQSGLLALDWNNGNRNVLVDPLLTGLLVGQTLHSSQAEIYRALIEATAFGSRVINDRLIQHGVPIYTIICCGGIAEKNAMLMQIYADVTGCKMEVSGSSQTCALGSGIAAAVVAGSEAGGYDSFAEAQANMCSLRDIVYEPIPENQAVYDRLYGLYCSLHDAFGGIDGAADLSGIMKDLIAIKESVGTANAI